MNDENILNTQKLHNLLNTNNIDNIIKVFKNHSLTNILKNVNTNKSIDSIIKKGNLQFIEDLFIYLNNCKCNNSERIQLVQFKKTLFNKLLNSTEKLNKSTFNELLDFSSKHFLTNNGDSDINTQTIFNIFSKKAAIKNDFKFLNFVLNHNCIQKNNINKHRMILGVISHSHDIDFLESCWNEYSDIIIKIHSNFSQNNDFWWDLKNTSTNSYPKKIIWLESKNIGYEFNGFLHFYKAFSHFFNFLEEPNYPLFKQYSETVRQPELFLNYLEKTINDYDYSLNNRISNPITMILNKKTSFYSGESIYDIIKEYIRQQKIINLKTSIENNFHNLPDPLVQKQNKI